MKILSRLKPNDSEPPVLMSDVEQRVLPVTETDKREPFPVKRYILSPVDR